MATLAEQKFSNMITNGDFSDGDDGWDYGPLITIADGKCSYDGEALDDLTTITDYIQSTEQYYRMRLTIDSVSNCNVRMYFLDVISEIFTTPGEKIWVFKPETVGLGKIGVLFLSSNGAAEAVIDNIKLDRLGELTAFTYNFLPDDESQFGVTEAAGGRSCIRNASWSIPSKCLILYDPALET